jgi:hypothetical protein
MFSGREKSINICDREGLDTVSDDGIAATGKEDHGRKQYRWLRSKATMSCDNQKNGISTIYYGGYKYLANQSGMPMK